MVKLQVHQIKDYKRKEKMMTISIDVLDNSGIYYDWRTLYVGVNENLIDCSELNAYALKIMGDDTYEDDEFINELAWGIQRDLKNELLVKMRFKFGFDTLTTESINWKIEIEKLRYGILNYLRNKITDNNKLLSKVEEVYADFNYPQDMEGFIPYMPIKDKCNLFINEIEYNNKRMINKLDEFLILEKNKIDFKL